MAHALYNKINYHCVKSSDKHYNYKVFYNVLFENIVIGDSFDYNGTTFTKKSSRTAFLYKKPAHWFYFKQVAMCDVYQNNMKDN